MAKKRTKEERDLFKKLLENFKRDKARHMEAGRKDPMLSGSRERRRFAEMIALDSLLWNLGYRYPEWSWDSFLRRVHDRLLPAEITRIVERCQQISLFSDDHFEAGRMARSAEMKA